MPEDFSVAIQIGDSDVSEVLELSMGAAPTQGELECVERHLLSLPQVEQKLTHTFSPGIYVRQLEIPKGAFVIGHMHKTEHINMLLKGKMTVVIDGRPVEVSAPYVVNSLPGTRKIGFAHEDSIWANIHATDETDLDKLEEQLIEKSETFKRHELEALQRHIAFEDEPQKTIEI